MTKHSHICLSLTLWLSAFSLTEAEVPLLINYQGRLAKDTNLVNDTVSLVLRFYTNATPELGEELLCEDSNEVVVVDGLYSTFIGDNITYGSLTNALAQPQLFLETEVDGTILSPRQRVAAVAYALVAGTMPSGSVMSALLADDAVTSDKIQDGTILFADIAGNNATNGQLMKWDSTLSRWIAADDETGSDWSLSGNAGTVPGFNFLGTIDNQPLELRVNSARALRLEPDGTAPRFIAGASNNTCSNAIGASVGGGLGNVAAGNYSIVGGGFSNSATGARSVIAGGSDNRASGNYSVVAGGWLNEASGGQSFVGGGYSNRAMRAWSAVLGGFNNAATGEYAVVSGGISNLAGGDCSFAFGRGAEAHHDYSVVWGLSAYPPTVSTTSGQFIVRAPNGVHVLSASVTPIAHGAQLAVESEVWTQHMVYLESRNLDGSAAECVLDICQTDFPAVATNMNLLACRVNTNPVFRVEYSGEVYADGAFHGGGADFTEMLPLSPESQVPRPGQVLALNPQHPGCVRVCSEAASPLVCGVTSEKPTVVGDAKLVAPNDGLRVPVAVYGIVPVTVVSGAPPIAVGDLLTSSDQPGCAQPASDPSPGTVLGKALEPLPAGGGTIRILLTLH